MGKTVVYTDYSWGQFTVLKDLRTGGGSRAGSIQTCSANKRERAFKPSRAGRSRLSCHGQGVWSVMITQIGCDHNS